MDAIRQSRSSHFSLEKIDEGIYAAIAEDGAASCNAGLIDLGGKVVVFDTFQSPQAAEDLRQAALDIFGHAPQIVVNSHWHSDHIWGNQIFTDQAEILSSTRTRALILGTSQQEADWIAVHADEQLRDYRSQLPNVNEVRRNELSLMINVYESLVEAMPKFSLCLPSITFNQRLRLHGTKRSAELITYKNGHTESDTVLSLRREGVLFVSDLLFIGFHPYICDGDPNGLLSALFKLERINAKNIIPGHGSVGTTEDLRREIQYIEYCIETARSIFESGGGVEEQITETELFESYQHWQFRSFYADNIRFLCQRFRDANKK